MEPVSPQQVIAAHQPTTVQAELADGRRLELSAPRVDDDTLFGTIRSGGKADNAAAALTGGTPPRDSGGPVTLPLSKIRTLALRRVDPVRTTFAVLGGVVVLGVVTLAVALRNASFGGLTVSP